MVQCKSTFQFPPQSHVHVRARARIIVVCACACATSKVGGARSFWCAPFRTETAKGQFSIIYTRQSEAAGRGDHATVCPVSVLYSCNSRVSGHGVRIMP